MSQDSTLKYPFPAVSVCHPISWKWPALINIWEKFDKEHLIGTVINNGDVYMAPPSPAFGMTYVVRYGTQEIAKLNFEKDAFPVEPSQSMIGYIEKHFHGDSVAIESALWQHFLIFHFANDIFKFSKMKKVPYLYFAELKTRWCKESCPGWESRGMKGKILNSLHNT